FGIWSVPAAREAVPGRPIAQAHAVTDNHLLDSWSQRPDASPPEARADYIDKFGSPDTTHAICEEYRASSTLDRQHDEADRGRRRITCPTLVLWSHTGIVADVDQPLEV